MEFWIMQTFYGLSYGSLLFMLSCGFTLIFGVMKFCNMAHASFYLLGGYVGITVLRWFGCTTVVFFLSILLSALTIAFLGVAIQRIFFRRLYGQDLAQVLMTLGFALIFQDLVLVLWGGDPYRVTIPQCLGGAFVLGDLHFPRYRMFMILAAAVVAAGLYLLLEKTNYGAKIRAAADDEEMAGGIGIKIPLISAGVFGLAAALAAIAGVIGGGFLSLYPGAGLIMIPLAVAVVIVGGLGSIKGAAVASLLLGLIDSFGKTFVPELAYFTMYAPMVIILAFRPTGLFGKA